MVNPPVAVVEVYKIISHHLSLRMAYCYSTNNNLRGAPGAPLTIGHQGWRRSQLAMSGGSSGTQTHLFLWNIGMPIMPMLQSHHVIFPVQSVWNIKQSLLCLMPASLPWCCERRRSFVPHCNRIHLALPVEVYNCIDSPKSDRIKW
jgi:hypothetical protein